jgi:hypothetical protein
MERLGSDACGRVEDHMSCMKDPAKSGLQKFKLSRLSNNSQTSDIMNSI